ncbi:MAG: MFS transporter [Anaerolineae bacterium]|nr:MFS transporter [Anaerolineae bacterium]
MMRASKTLPPGYWTIWIATLLFFVAFYTLLVPMPLYLEGIGVSDWLIGVIMGAFGIASLVARPLAGVAADRVDRRAVLGAGAASLVIGAAGVTLATAPAALFGLRLLQAIGYVAFTTAGTALVSDMAHPEHRAQTLAVFGIAANVAMVMTPAAISAVLGVLTIQGALLLAAVLAAIAGLMALRVRAAPPGAAPPTRWRGLLRPPDPLLIPMLAAWIMGLGFGAYLQFLPLLAERRGIPAAGLVYTVYGVSIILTRLATGRRLDGPGRGGLLRLGYVLLAGGLAVLAVAYSLPLLMVGAAGVAVAGGIIHPALIAIHVERMPAAARGRAVAFFYLGFDLGIGLGAWLLSPILQNLGVTGMYAAAALISIAGVLLVPSVARRLSPTPAISSS